MSCANAAAPALLLTNEPPCEPLLLHGLPWLFVHWLLLLAALPERAGPPPAPAAAVVAVAAAPPMVLPTPPYCEMISVTCSKANKTQRLASCGAE